MIFVTLGSQKFQFNRLLLAVDQIIENGEKEEVFAQIGFSDYVPQNFKYKAFLDREEFANKMEQADIIITHGGSGAIIGAIKKGKKVIAVPRLSRFGEHVDDHQVQLVEQFRKQNLIYACYDCEKLEQALKDARTMHFMLYHTDRMRIISSIEDFIETVDNHTFIQK